MRPTWQPHPSIPADHHGQVVNNADGTPAFELGHQVEILMDASGREYAMIEDFGYAAYPCAINAKTGNLERGGAFTDRVAAMLWAERVAGLAPTKEGDERPPFYYDG